VEAGFYEKRGIGGIKGVIGILRNRLTSISIMMKY